MPDPSILTALAPVAAQVAPAPAAHVMTPAELQAWNRQQNAAHALNNRVVQWADEGKDGYDCKGFSALKAQALHDQGVPWEEMRVLIAQQKAYDKQPAHAVLQYRDSVLDNLSGWVNSPSDYTVIQRLDPQMWASMLPPPRSQKP